MRRTVDVECYRDYFLIKFRCMATQRMWSFPMWPGRPLDIALVWEMMKECTLYTFNGRNYDMPMILLALQGVDNGTLKQASDLIIQQNVKPWEFYKMYGLIEPDWLDHVDVMEVAPGVGISLKMYAGRMHYPHMQDLPLPPNALIEPLKRIIIDEYCGNDNGVTQCLVEGVADRLALREDLSRIYRVDLRSKSDAQVAEAVFKAKLDFKPEKRFIPHGFAFQYIAPGYIGFQTPELQRLHALVTSVYFTVGDKEQAYMMGDYESELKTGVNMPRELAELIITRPGWASQYKIGIGGLHSQESCIRHLTMPGLWTITDHDVASYYPSLILGAGMVPQQIGEAFTIIYRALRDRRLLAKSEAERIAVLWESMGSPELKDEADKLKSEADGLKIVLNGVFGKLLNKHSIFYAPELGIKVTLTGQLALLMLIETLELAGIAVVSANTDGIVLRTPAGLEWARDRIIREWEQHTGLVMESKTYKGLWMRDVNNYIAIDSKGKVKRKGVFGSGCLWSPEAIAGKHPDKDICGDAVVAFLKDGTPIEKTIRECTDIRKFVQVRAVRGGGRYIAGNWRVSRDYWDKEFAQQTSLAKRLVRTEERHAIKEKREPRATPEIVQALAAAATAKTKMAELLAYEHQYLGKAVRWYIGCNDGYIGTPALGMVAGSEGATPVMRLPETFPTDVNYQHYIDVAQQMLKDIGVPI